MDTRAGSGGSAAEPQLSVVMPTHRQAHTLEPVLESLAGQTLSADAFEVVVVEDPSEVCYDRVAKLAQEHGFHFHTLPEHAGRSATRNRVLELVRGRILLFLDSDCYVPPDTLERHLRWHRESPAARAVLGARLEVSSLAVAGRLMREAVIRPEERERYCYDIRFPPGLSTEHARLAMETPWLFAYTNISVPRELVAAVGGFDEEFGMRWGLEDIDLFYRIYVQLGRPRDAFVYDESIVTYHLPHYRNMRYEFGEFRSNEPYFRRKHLHFETEFSVDMPFLNGYKVRVYRERVRQLVDSGAGRPDQPVWEKLVRIMSERHDAPRVLYAGMGTDRLPLPAGTSTVDHGRPESSVNRHLLGCATGYPDYAFDIVANVDLWRILRWDEFCAHVQEALRIAGELVLVHTGVPLAGAGEIEGDAVGDDQDLHYLAQALSPHTVTTMERCGGATVMRLRGAVT